MILELEKDLAAALASPEVQEALETLVRRVVREELQASPVLDELLDADQAAELLKMSKAAVLKAAQRGGLPAVRHGRRVRFRRRDLLAAGR
jgi:excisionase family DNA binding protein